MKKSIQSFLIIVVIASVVVLGGAYATDIFTSKMAVATASPNTTTQAAIEQEQEIETKPAIETNPAIETTVAIVEASPVAVEKPKTEKKTVAKEEPKTEPIVEPVVETPAPLEIDDSKKTAKRIEYITTCNNSISKEEATKLVSLFEEFANDREYISVELLMGMARLESTYRVNVGEKYIGLMQVSAYYGQQAGYTLDQLKDPYYNLKYAFEILDDLNIKCKGDIKNTLQAYNMGYYALKNKLAAGEEISYSFYNVCKRYADQITASYEE